MDIAGMILDAVVYDQVNCLGEKGYLHEYMSLKNKRLKAVSA